MSVSHAINLAVKGDKNGLERILSFRPQLINTKNEVYTNPMILKNIIFPSLSI